MSPFIGMLAENCHVSNALPTNAEQIKYQNNHENHRQVEIVPAARVARKRCVPEQVEHNDNDDDPKQKTHSDMLPHTAMSLNLATKYLFSRYLSRQNYGVSEASVPGEEALRRSITPP